MDLNNYDIGFSSNIGAQNPGDWPTYYDDIEIYDYAINEHVFMEYTSNEDATCSSNGTKTSKCVHCETTYTCEDIDSILPHTFTTYVPNNDGTHTLICEHNSEHTSVEKCEYEWIVTKEPGLEKGEKEGTCKYCSHKVTEEIAPSHTCEFDSDYTIDVEATCEEVGSKSKHCLTPMCDKVIEVTEIPALGHTVVVDPKVEATCTVSGLTEGSHCGVCNELLKPQFSHHMKK